MGQKMKWNEMKKKKKKKKKMDSLANLIITGLILNKFLVVGWSAFWFCVELLLYPKFLNNGLSL